MRGVGLGRLLIRVRCGSVTVAVTITVMVTDAVNGYGCRLKVQVILLLWLQ